MGSELQLLPDFEVTAAALPKKRNHWTEQLQKRKVGLIGHLAAAMHSFIDSACWLLRPVAHLLTCLRSAPLHSNHNRDIDSGGQLL